MGADEIARAASEREWAALDAYDFLGSCASVGHVELTKALLIIHTTINEQRQERQRRRQQPDSPSAAAFRRTQQRISEFLRVQGGALPHSF